jgi:uncharacterized membrane protein YbhN (UPF0104 family)
MERRRLRWGTLAFLAVALVFVVLGLVAWRGELTRLVSEARGFDWMWRPGLILAALLAAAAALVATGATWVHLFRAAGARISYRDGITAWIGSNLGRYIPGKVWQLAGLASFAKASGHPGGAAISTSILLQSVTLLTGLAWGAAVAGGHFVGSDRTAFLQLAAVMVLLIILVQPPVVRTVARLAGRLLDEPAAQTAPGARQVLGSSLVLGAVWALYGLGFWSLCLGTLGEVTPSYLQCTGIFAAAYVAGYLVLIAPGGILVREGAMTALLVALAGLPAAAAAALSVGARIWVTVAELSALGAGLVTRRRG